MQAATRAHNGVDGLQALQRWWAHPCSVCSRRDLKLPVVSDLPLQPGPGQQRSAQLTSLSALASWMVCKTANRGGLRPSLLYAPWEVKARRQNPL